ncbi:MAG: hypothetical protein QOH49_871 [Acidobacteriota bacterium]|jgi:hypothetical protein|nr:hypothetical protein [Acidobacteriota bacterium]
MRPRARLIVSTLLTLLLAWQVCGQTMRTKPTPAAVTVTMCELFDDPAAYKGRAVRFTAVYRQAGEDLAALECPGCRDMLWQPHFEDSFDSCTAREVRDKFKLDVTLVVTVVGWLRYSINSEGKPYGFSFRMACAEKAERVGRGSSYDLDLPKVKRLVNCGSPTAPKAEEKKDAPNNLPQRTSQE